MRGADLPFFVSGCSECDMGQIADTLPSHRRVFAHRWKADAAIGFTPEMHAGLIILGDGKDWATSVCYQREREWLARALKSGAPVLGICHGAQLLAAFLEQRIDGKPLAKRRTKEHYGSLTQVAVEGEGRTDPVVGHLADGVPVTQYHEDAFQEPPGTTALVWSRAHSYRHCEAFRVGGPEAAVYGIQFHAEPTLQMLRDGSSDGPWFKTAPPFADLQRAAEAGAQAIRAWVELATARRATGAGTVVAPNDKFGGGGLTRCKP